MKASQSRKVRLLLSAKRMTLGFSLQSNFIHLTLMMLKLCRGEAGEVFTSRLSGQWEKAGQDAKEWPGRGRAPRKN